jgi:hypothetical protein
VTKPAKSGTNRPAGVKMEEKLTTESTEDTEGIASRYKDLPPLFAVFNLLPNLIFYSVLSVSSVVK